MGMISEFKEFAMRGNVVDLAIGVVIGGAFGKIVTSLVDGVVMPIVAMLTGGVNVGDWAMTLKAPVVGPDGKEIAAAVLLKYGSLIQSVVDFLIIAFVIFLVVKAMNAMKKKEQAAPPAAPAADVVLLTEIRDLLKQNQNR
jgi:large conductance mechanosensitive channel